MSQSFFDTQSERAILAGIFQRGFDVLPESAPSSAGSFSELNGIIFDAAKVLRDRGEAVNSITLTVALRDTGNLDRVGGPAYLSGLETESCFDGLLESACLEVAKHFKRRELRKNIADALKQVDNGDHEAALDFLNQRLPWFTAGETSNAVLSPALLSDEALESLDIPTRPALLGDWFRSGDYGVIFGRRGLGKSWLAMGIARALAEGRDFGPWGCPAARRVLYVDGEMSLDDYRERVRALSEGVGNMLSLSHQAVFDRTQKALCLSDPRQQDELTRLCEQENIGVLFLDNGACLFRGVAENDADDFRDKIEGWLLDLRRRGVAVVLVLHAGRNNAIRGTSKREDAAFWILRLDEANGGEHDQGARFLTRFVKNRNAPQDPPPLDWQFKPSGDKTLITYREADSMAIFRQWIEDGLNTCGEIAEEMGITKGTVSKMAKRAEKDGWLKIQGRKYSIFEP